MKAISGKDMCRELEKNGWLLRRALGSHHIYGKPGSIAPLSVPVYVNQLLKIGLLRHLMKMGGLSEEDL